MFTVSCYAFHPLLQRFVRIWRYVQLVSDVITFVLSMICCQCSDVVPLSSSASEESKPSVKIFEAYAMNRRSNQVDSKRYIGEHVEEQHLVIDFTPGREDTPEIQAKCQEFWQLAKNRAEHQRTKSSKSLTKPQTLQMIKSSDAVLPEIIIETSNKNNNLPAIHMGKKLKNKGAVKEALQTGVVNKCCV